MSDLLSYAGQYLSSDNLEIFTICVLLCMFQFVLNIFGWFVGHRS